VTDDHTLPIDADVDLHVTADRAELDIAHGVPVLAAIAGGGVLGALARYWLTEVFPAAADEVHWSLIVVNVSGSLLIGVLMVLVVDVFPQRRLLRPFVGVGLLGGYTTFSTAMVDVQQALDAEAVAVAMVSLVGTVVASLVAVWVGTTVTRVALRHRAGARR
jgi:fluoride exporter